MDPDAEARRREGWALVRAGVLRIAASSTLLVWLIGTLATGDPRWWIP